MSFKFSELSEKLSYYLLEPPDLVMDDYDTELKALVRVFQRITTPTIVKKGNVFEMQDPFPEQPDPYRLRLNQIVLARLERTISIETYLESIKEAKGEFEQGNSAVK